MEPKRTAVRLLYRDDLQPLEWQAIQRGDGAEQTRRMLEDWGFLTVRRSDLLELREKAYGHMSAFFSLPEEERLTIYHKVVEQGVSGNYGYFPMGSETAVRAASADPKEFLHIGRLGEGSAEKGSRLGPWPAALPGFASFFTELFEELERVSKGLLAALAEAFSYDPSLLGGIVENGNSILRCVHYPAFKGSANDGPRMRAEPHTGIQLLGVQLPGTDRGLQFWTPRGEWVEPVVEDFEDCLLVNIGEMAEILLEKKVAPTLHRVVADEKAATRSRYAGVFFFHPNHAAAVRSLRADSPQDGRTWGELLLERLRQLKIR